MAHESDGLAKHIKALVKWYDPNKGFGFVQPSIGGGDAFLHASLLSQGGYRDVADGDELTCDIAPGPRGAQVVAIHQIERREQPEAISSRSGGDQPGESVDGTVKFFDAGKGFGFVAPDGGGKDVFVSARMLSRCGLTTLEPDQRVRVSIRQGPKGPIAEDIKLI